MKDSLGNNCYNGSILRTTKPLIHNDVEIPVGAKCRIVGNVPSQNIGNCWLYFEEKDVRLTHVTISDGFELVSNKNVKPVYYIVSDDMVLDRITLIFRNGDYRNIHPFTNKHTCLAHIIKEYHDCRIVQYDPAKDSSIDSHDCPTWTAIINHFTKRYQSGDLTNPEVRSLIEAISNIPMGFPNDKRYLMIWRDENDTTGMDLKNGCRAAVTDDEVTMTMMVLKNATVIDLGET